MVGDWGLLRSELYSLSFGSSQHSRKTNGVRLSMVLCCLWIETVCTRYAKAANRVYSWAHSTPQSKTGWFGVQVCVSDKLGQGRSEL